MQQDAGGGQRREIAGFLQALDSTPPDAVTACRGWTAHEVIAHLASGADAFANQVEAYLDGRPVPEFGAWQVRETPYRAMDDAALRRRLETSERRMSDAFAAMLADDPNARSEEVGWGLPVAELVKHMRQEYAVHRWDLIGDDDLGMQLLGQQDLLVHSVELLGDSLLANGLQRDPQPAESLTARLRCDGEQDLVLSVRDGTGSLSLAEPVDAPDVIETDPAARLIILWGRRPADSRRVRSTLAPERLTRLQILLAGY